MTGKGARELSGVKEMLCILKVVVVTQVYKSGKTHPTVYGKWVCFIVKRSMIPQ